MRLIVLVLVAFIAAFAPLTAADRLDPSRLTAVKAGTVYIKTARGTGSGFLIKTDKEGGWIVTNAHVIADAWKTNGKVEVVFDGGSQDERVIAAVISAADEDRDLAILRIEEQRLPRPLLLQTRAQLEETMPVWVIGFPFGEALALGAKNPAPTITSTEISSLRMRDNGEVDIIQTSGGINPGNSGGPIVTSRGEVIAVSVAKVRGADIGFGIPIPVLEDTLGGRIARADPVITAMNGEKATVTLTAYAIDPFANITKVTALVVPTAEVRDALKSNAKGEIIAPIAHGMTRVSLEYDGKKATGTVEIEVPKNGERGVTVQYQYIRKDRRTIYTNDIKCRVGGTPIASAGNNPSGVASPNRQVAVDFTYEKPAMETIAIPKSAFVVGTQERESDGKSFTAVTAPQEVLDLGEDVLQVATHAWGKELYLIRKDVPSVFVLDPVTLKILAEIPTPESPTSIWADHAIVGVSCGKSRVVTLIDSTKRALLTSGSLNLEKNYTPETVVGRAPDGSIMSIWQLEGGAWWDRALAHTKMDGTTTVMINGEGIYWATWLFDGTGIIGQSNPSSSPSATCDLHFPNGPRNFAELHNKKPLKGGFSHFHTSTGPVFASSDRRTYVWPREREGQHGVPWTYLLHPSFDRVEMEFPGCAILEIPERRMYVSIGQDTVNGETKSCCFYISSVDGRIVRRITLEEPVPQHQKIGGRVRTRAVFIPNHEYIIVPEEKFTGQGTTRTFVRYRCGPVADAIEAPIDARAVNDPPAKVVSGSAISFTPSVAEHAKASDFRLKRTLPGMNIDPKSGTWTWTPEKAYVGRWPITILATVNGEEAEIISWTLVVE